jgi:hypothetical protein
MTLEQVAVKYGISKSFLECKEDAITISIKSLEELQKDFANQALTGPEIAKRLMKLKNFLFDVKSSTMY